MPRIGLVLGAGGAVGRAFHAGVLAAAQEVGWDAREAVVVVGTSAGSVAAAVLRAGVNPRDYAALTVGEPISAEAVRILGRRVAAPGPAGRPRAPRRWHPAAPRHLIRTLARPWQVRWGTLLAAALPEGAERHDDIATGIGPLFGTSWPARPTWIVAARLDDGARVAFGKDGAPRASIGEAVSASCAIPGWFAPVSVAGVRYVDGGAWSLTNVDLVAGLGLDAVVVSSPMSAVPSAWALSPDGALRAVAHAQLRRETARLRKAGTQIVALEPDADDLRVMGTIWQAMDRDRRPAVARHVRRAFVRRLESARALLEAMTLQ